MNFNNKILKKLKKDDIVRISTSLDTKLKHRYLIRSIDKNNRYLVVLALEPYFESKVEMDSPIISLPFSMIKKITHGDKNDLLFLIDKLNNPHISSAIMKLK